MRNPAAASAALTLMFVSLLAIFIVVPQNDAIITLSVVIMGIGLVITLTDRQGGDIMTMAGLAAIVSVTAAYFVGQSLFGNIGAIAIALIWLGVLFTVARRASAETVVIPEDHAFMVAPFLGSQAEPVSSSLPLTSLPFLDRHVATIPTYELVKDVVVKNINTRAHNDIDQIDVHTRYRVTKPDHTLRGVPNRGQIQSEVAREMGMSITRARLDVAFWEKLLAKQMSAEVDDIVRKVVFNSDVWIDILQDYEQDNLEIARKFVATQKKRLADLIEEYGSDPSELQKKEIKAAQDDVDKASKAVTDIQERMKVLDQKVRSGSLATLLDAYNQREALAKHVRRELQQLVSRWGVRIEEIALDYYVVNRDAVKGLKGGPEVFDKDLAKEQKKRKSISESDATHIALMGEARATAIRKLIEQVKAAHPDIRSQEVSEIVKAALLAGASDLEEVEEFIVAQAGAKK
jgi:hypothetical protein